jgi:two-component system chemotaxis sensor kinase CheA
VSQEKFHEFIDSTVKLLVESRRLIQDTPDAQTQVIDVLFRNMHTIKGNARTYGLLSLTNSVHVVEQSYADLRSKVHSLWDAGLLLQEMDGVQALVEQYAHLNDVVLGRKGPGWRASPDRYMMVERALIDDVLQRLHGALGSDASVLQQTLSEVDARLRSIGTQALGEILAGTLESLPSLASELGRAPPRVTIADHGILILTQAGGMLRNLFTHLLRNALDHGIESAAERRALDKPARGHSTERHAAARGAER